MTRASALFPTVKMQHCIARSHLPSLPLPETTNPTTSSRRGEERKPCFILTLGARFPSLPFVLMKRASRADWFTERSSPVLAAVDRPSAATERAHGDKAAVLSSRQADALKSLGPPRIHRYDFATKNCKPRSFAISTRPYLARRSPRFLSRASDCVYLFIYFFGCLSLVGCSQFLQYERFPICRALGAHEEGGRWPRLQGGQSQISIDLADGRPSCPVILSAVVIKNRYW